MDEEYSLKKIYMGQTEDLSIRFDNHHILECFNKYNKNCICVYAGQGTEKRLAIERNIIEHLETSCNKW